MECQCLDAPEFKLTYLWSELVETQKQAQDSFSQQLGDYVVNFDLSDHTITANCTVLLDSRPCLDSRPISPNLLC